MAERTGGDGGDGGGGGGGGDCIGMPVPMDIDGTSLKHDHNEVANGVTDAFPTTNLDPDVAVFAAGAAADEDDHAEEEMDDVGTSTMEHEEGPSSSNSHVLEDNQGISMNDVTIDEENGDVLELDTDYLVMQDECCDDDMTCTDGTHRARSKSENYSNKVALSKGAEVRRRYVSASPLRYTPPTPLTCGDSVEIQALMHKAQFFLARSCKENIWIAKEKSLWTTTRGIEKLIGEAFYKASAVILIFLARNANHFSGFAKVCSAALYKGQPAVRWKDFNGGGNIKISWISKCSLDIKATRDIKNSFNKEREVYAGQDGCEIQRVAGQRLCSLFPFDRTVNLSELRKKTAEKAPRKRSRLPSRRRFFYNSDRVVLPSLFENRVSYTQFKRAKRDLSFEEFYEKIRRDELRFFFGPPFRNGSRRSLFAEGPRPLFYDSLSVPRPDHPNYRQRERSPLPSLLDSVPRFLPQSMFHRPVRLLDEIRSGDKRYSASLDRRTFPRKSGRNREYEVAESSRKFRNDRKLKIFREENSLRKSEKKQLKEDLSRNATKSPKKEHTSNSDGGLRERKKS